MPDHTLPYVNRIYAIIATRETTPSRAQDDLTVINKIEVVVNEAIIAGALDDLRVILNEHAAFLRNPSIEIISALLKLGDEVISFIDDDDGELEVTRRYRIA